MKKLFILLFTLLCAFVFSGCKDNKIEKAIGSWKTNELNSTTDKYDTCTIENDRIYFDKHSFPIELKNSGNYVTVHPAGRSSVICTISVLGNDKIRIERHGIATKEYIRTTHEDIQKIINTPDKPKKYKNWLEDFR